MGRDNHPKERQAIKLARKRASRETFDRILIVCEGSKTEPQYFNEIRREYRLHSANICIQPGGYGTSPKQVIDFARDLFLNGDSHLGIERCSFEQVYAVFDRDAHLSYYDALKYSEILEKKFKKNKKPIQFKAIASVPNFELWLLLHFQFVSKPIERDEVIFLLKQYLKDYEKGRAGYFSMTKEQLPIAISRAEKLQKLYNRYDGKYPYTDIVHLVQLLVALKP